MNCKVRRSYFHRGGETALSGATIPEHFSAIVSRFGEREAIVSSHQARRLSYAALKTQVDIAARALIADGFGKGSRVGIWSTNNVEWVLLQLATARIGAILVNVNPAYRARELAYALERSEIEALFLNARFTAEAMRFDENDRLCVSVPFYHCFGMVLSNLLCFSVGACAVVPSEHFDAGAVLECVEREHCTAIHGVPTMFIAALEHPRFADTDLTSLRTGIMAGAPCPPGLMRRVMDDMHVPEILIGYGETEASPLTHLTNASDSFGRRVESVGRNLPHQEVKVVDPESGATLDLGEDGEICFRGYHLMKGYYGDPEATREAIDENGWLHSGDIGHMDGEGYVRVTGRRKEMIIRGGENIYPRKIEDFLFTHPKVAEVAVFGIPDEYYGEAVAAWIQPRTGERLSAEEIREFCKGHIARFKIPSHIELVEEFPMTVTGKLQKFRMREIAVKRMKEASATRA